MREGKKTTVIILIKASTLVTKVNIKIYIEIKREVLVEYLKRHLTGKETVFNYLSTD